MCPIFQQEIETVEHLICGCEWTRALWFGSNLNITLNVRPSARFRSGLAWCFKLLRAARIEWNIFVWCYGWNGIYGRARTTLSSTIIPLTLVPPSSKLGRILMNLLEYLCSVNKHLVIRLSCERHQGRGFPFCKGGLKPIVMWLSSLAPWELS